MSRQLYVCVRAQLGLRCRCWLHTRACSPICPTQLFNKHGHSSPPPAPPPPPVAPVCSAQSAMELFTDIHVGEPLHSFYNGGPGTSGPNAGAFTTYWSIRRCAHAWGGACDGTQLAAVMAAVTVHVPVLATGT